VLVAYDGSEHAKAAIREAAGQLTAGRDAVVLTVWTPPSALPFGVPDDGGPVFDAGLEAEARGVAREGAHLAESVGFRAEPVIAAGGSVWRTIVKEADRRKATIIVMGSHGRTGLASLLMGSVAAAVSRHAHQAVLIVHGPRHGDRAGEAAPAAAPTGADGLATRHPRAPDIGHPSRRPTSRALPEAR